jgi:tetratricopeptide (TPR) repeat protein
LPNLDELHQLIRKIAIDINNRMNTLQNAVESSSSKDSEQLQSLTNLQNCVRSAASVVSSASTTLAVDQPDHFSVTYGSEFGDVFPAEPGETMLRWISSNTVYEFEDEPNSDLSSGVNVTSEKSLQPVDEGTGSEQSDSDNDLEVEIFQVLLNKGKEKLEAKDYKGAERLFKNCLTRMSSSGSLVSLHRIPKSKPEIMNFLLDTYLAQEKWSEAQAILLEKIALASRDKSKDNKGVLAEMLTLIDVLLHKKSYAEALLYGRRALKGYRKLGSEGIGGVEKSLRVLVRVCRLDENFDEEDAYATLLSDFLRQHPPRRKSSPSLGPVDEVSGPTSPPKTHQADQKVSGHPPSQQAPSSPKETSVPVQDNNSPNVSPILGDDPRRFLATQLPRDKEPTREECLAISDEQCQSILQNRDPNTSKTYKDWELPHQTHLVRLYMTRMSFPEIKECMKTEFGITYS